MEGQLRSLRNMIHVNLFVSFIIRAVLSYLKDILLVSHLGFPSDVRIGEDGQTEFIVEGSHVACRALFSLFNYILQTNFVWLLLEGVHVHIVLFFPTFSVKIKLLWFMIMGWCFPSLYVIAWAISRLQQDNTLCWNVNILSNLYWFLKAPIIASIAINFILFLNMVRLLYTKVSAMSISDSRKSRKLGRGTLILIPLYGVYNVVFILIPEDQLDEYGQFITLFIEMFVNSFQGFLIAIVFCFRNQQVRSEVYRLWQRFLLNRSDLGPVDRSRTWSTLSHIPRPRIGSQSSNTSDKSKHPSAVNKAAEKNSRQITPQGNEDNTEQSNLLSRTLSTVHERVEPKQFFVKPPSENYDMETERVIPVSQSNV